MILYRIYDHWIFFVQFYPITHPAVGTNVNQFTYNWSLTRHMCLQVIEIIRWLEHNGVPLCLRRIVNKRVYIVWKSTALLDCSFKVDAVLESYYAVRWNVSLIMFLIYLIFKLNITPPNDNGRPKKRYTTNGLALARQRLFSKFHASSTVNDMPCDVCTTDTPRTQMTCIALPMILNTQIFICL